MMYGNKFVSYTSKCELHLVTRRWRRRTIHTYRDTFVIKVICVVYVCGFLDRRPLLVSKVEEKKIDISSRHTKYTFFHRVNFPNTWNTRKVGIRSTEFDWSARASWCWTRSATSALRWSRRPATETSTCGRWRGTSTWTRSIRQMNALPPTISDDDETLKNFSLTTIHSAPANRNRKEWILML